MILECLCGLCVVWVLIKAMWHGADVCVCAHVVVDMKVLWLSVFIGSTEILY